MNKEHIIKAIWNQLPDLTINETKKVYETTINLIKNTLAKGETIKIKKFGKFTVKEKNPRMGQNPRTGQEAVITERRVVSFRPSKIFRNQVMDGDRSSD